MPVLRQNPVRRPSRPRSTEPRRSGGLEGQAGLVAVRSDPDLRRLYSVVMHRHGRPKAKVAVARKLLIRLYIMLRDQIDYAEFRVRAVGCTRGSRHAPITGVKVPSERRRRGVAGSRSGGTSRWGGYPDTGRLLQRDPGGNARCVIRPTRGISAIVSQPWGLSSRVCPPATRPKRREGAPKNRLDRGDRSHRRTLREAAGRLTIGRADLLYSEASSFQKAGRELLSAGASSS